MSWRRWADPIALPNEIINIILQSRWPTFGRVGKKPRGRVLIQDDTSLMWITSWSCHSTDLNGENPKRIGEWSTIEELRSGVVYNGILYHSYDKWIESRDQTWKATSRSNRILRPIENLFFSADRQYLYAIAATTQLWRFHADRLSDGQVVLINVRESVGYRRSCPTATPDGFLVAHDDGNSIAEFSPTFSGHAVIDPVREIKFKKPVRALAFNLDRRLLYVAHYGSIDVLNHEYEKIATISSPLSTFEDFTWHQLQISADGDLLLHIVSLAAQLEFCWHNISCL